MTRRYLILILFGLLSCFAAELNGQSQATTGTIQGFVKDESGAVIPGARVTIRHVQTGLTRELSTDASGFYRAISLPSGNYEVSCWPGWLHHAEAKRHSVVDWTIS